MRSTSSNRSGPRTRASLLRLPSLVVALLTLLLLTESCRDVGPIAEGDPNDSVPEAATGGTDDDGQTDPPVLPTEPPALTGDIGYEVVASYPHDTTAFTQGLEVVDGRLIESTGKWGESDRRFVNMETGETIAEIALDDAYFGEGITERDGELFQLTFLSETVLISDSDTLVATGETFRYTGPGWGLCVAEQMSGRPFVMSNGTDKIALRNPEDFSLRSTLTVSNKARPVDQLNELECVGGQVLANLWKANLIVAINLETGEVEGVLDLSDLVPENLAENAVLNGIAYRPETDTFLVTGKLWPVLYELKLSSGPPLE